MQELSLHPSKKLHPQTDFNLPCGPPIFIVGSGRSGTTLLRDILGKHQNIYPIQGETHLFSDKSNPYIEYLNAFEAGNDIKSLTLTIISSIIFGHECATIFARKKKFPKEVKEILCEVKEFFNLEDYKERYGVFDLCAKFITFKENKNRWVEKTPSNIFNITHILNYYPNAKFIHIYRDPRAVYCSWKYARQDYFQNSNIFECLYTWNTAQTIAEDLLHNSPGQFYNLRYENLITNQEEELKKLCNFIDEEYEKSLLDIEVINSSFVQNEKGFIKEMIYRWKSKLSSYEIILIDIKTRKNRYKLNYPDSNKKLTILNIIGFIPFLITKRLKGKAGLALTAVIIGKLSPFFSFTSGIVGKFLTLISLINRIAGKFSTLISHINIILGKFSKLLTKNIILSYEIIASLRNKNYNLKTTIKTIFRCISRKQKIKKYLETLPVKKLQIGSGKNILSGWINTDLNPSSSEIIFLDASRRFPFDNETLDYICSKHYIEHLNLNRGLFMLNECCRVLKHGGKIRIATLNLESVVDLYKTKDKTKIQEFYTDFICKNYLSRYTDKYKNDTLVINTLFNNFGHEFIYDKETLKQLLEQTGFANIKSYLPGESEDENLKNLEQHNAGFEHADELNKFETIVLEGTKP